ncbi:uncharacterized protein YALI1_E23498g [Yarrowia lipolytica]|uniref:Uncharacterized protein n=1 Tax=Yarrowia lipolytica TaxID=4952 RepID=A0A1D8NJ58_YARLL|nr:hypothetical protein YALI1_E23498g [Yarrowia lipolytica]
MQTQTRQKTQKNDRRHPVIYICGGAPMRKNATATCQRAISRYLVDTTSVSRLHATLKQRWTGAIITYSFTSTDHFLTPPTERPFSTRRYCQYQ